MECQTDHLNGVLTSLLKQINKQIMDGDYSSYKVESGKNGYTIEYRANDPTVLESHRSLNSDEHKEDYLVLPPVCVVNFVVINIRWSKHQGKVECKNRRVHADAGTKSAMDRKVLV